VSESLACRLLRLSSGGLSLILSGRTLKDHLGPELDRALGRRVLVELPSLDEWPPCAGCDQGCEARPIRELDGWLVAMCPHDSTSDEVLTGNDVRQFRVEAEELCLAIREDSGLGGDGPKQLAPGIWLISHASHQHAPPRVIFVAFETDLGAAAILAMLKRVADPRPVSLLLAGHVDLELRLALEDAGIVALPVSELLVNDSTAPFQLDTALLTSSRPKPRLVLRRSDQSVTFDGASKVLSDQSFNLLLVLAKEAQAGRPHVENRSIEDELWATAIEGQVGDAIRRLRDALASVLGGRKQANKLVRNRPGKYFINMDFAVIEII
jgi:hypothetical protein